MITFCIVESSEKHDQADEQQPTSRSASRHLKRKWTCYWSVGACRCYYICIPVDSSEAEGKILKYFHGSRSPRHSITYHGGHFLLRRPFRSINWQKCGHPRGNVRIYKRMFNSPDLIAVFILFFIKVFLCFFFLQKRVEQSFLDCNGFNYPCFITRIIQKS